MKDIIKIIFVFTIFTSCNATSQNLQKLTFNSLEKELVTFLIKKDDILKSLVDEYKSEKRHLNIQGVQNGYNKGDLIDGIYSFSTLTTHTRSYFVIVDSNVFTILDISTRSGLEEAIKNTLNFCEKKKICVEITNDYVVRLLRVYYKKNKNVAAGIDINCERGVNDTKNLP